VKRFPDWEARLAAYTASAQKQKFAWGTFDCALAACGAAQAITGEDPAASVRGKYSTEAQAQALFGASLGNFAASIAQTIGAKEVRPTFGRRGDIVLADNGTPSGALGFVDLSGRFAWAASDKGMARLTMKRWKRAWLVG
jgi:hypothetical protein